jgi:hypothetical protein
MDRATLADGRAHQPGRPARYLFRFPPLLVDVKGEFGFEANHRVIPAFAPKKLANTIPREDFQGTSIITLCLFFAQACGSSFRIKIDVQMMSVCPAHGRMAARNSRPSLRDLRASLEISARSIHIADPIDIRRAHPRVRLAADDAGGR